MKTYLLSDLDRKQCPGEVCNKSINAEFYACELWVKRVGTFGLPMTPKFYSAFY